MLSLSQRGNLLFVAPATATAIPPESPWREETQQNMLAEQFMALVQLSEERNEVA